MAPSPQKRRHDSLVKSRTFQPPPKRRPRKQTLPFIKQESTDVHPSSHSLSTRPLDSLDPPKLFTMNPDPHTGVVPNHPTVLFNTSSEEQYTVLESEAYMLSLRREDEYVADKGTEKAYARHIRNYEKWWASDQARRQDEAECKSTIWHPLPAHPITPTKAAIFLDYELHRPKKSAAGKELLNCRVGSSSVKQTINALEHYRHHHQRDPAYKGCPESHTRLRDHPDITQIERAARASEPERQADSQEMKAKGQMSGAERPDFIPKFDIPEAGEYGYRDWYHLLLFPSNQSEYQEMSAETPPPNLLASLFPWIEEEEAAYKDRRERNGRLALDESLTYFLSLLRFLRLVALQDAAVLYQHDQSAPIFRFAPFNSAAFKAFSDTSTSIIQQAEDESRQRLHDLPEKIASTFHGAMATALIKQAEHQQAVESANIKTYKQMAMVEDVLRAVLAIQAASAGSRKRKAFEELSKAAHISEEPPLPSTADEVNNGRSSSSSTPLPLSSQLSVFASGGGNVYPARAFPMDLDNAETRAIQMKVLSDLEAKVDPAKLKNHMFEWCPKRDEWLPLFTDFWKPSKAGAPTPLQIWKEHTEGMDGFMSIEQLTEHWGARWKRNEARLRTESARRGRVVELIKKLSSQPNWNVEKARFIEYLQKKGAGNIDLIINASSTYNE
ncbi:hypothetical protein NLJ89_g11203 [Agrocybe chaxingu]|uniref:Transcription activator GCR1-like domain-containing protein n=1 Tax=Agrocybe chaxingu TaxID=84603 RepID=A0A9W8MN83_9AGAR|nr:hypothetical protein NLJ89_g11203 [Agrocybe chaxingu]